MKRIVLALSALSLIAGASAPAFSAPCKDSKGKFIKCPKAPAAKPRKCRNAKGHFMKCSK